MSDVQTLQERLRIRAKIRRAAKGRKSVEEGKPDRIADLLDEAAQALDEKRQPVDWEEHDRLDAFGTYGGRIIPYNGVWKIYLAETNCELWSFKTKEEAEAKFADAMGRSGYSDEENPLTVHKVAIRDALAYINHVGSNWTMRGEPHPQQWLVDKLENLLK